MKRIISMLMIIIIIVLMCSFVLVGCGDESYRVDYNITREAQNFGVYRRVVVINCLNGDTLFEIEGVMNIEADVDDNQLELIVEIAKGKYKKHFIGLSNNVSYTVEDISGEQVSPYHYELNYNPKMWLPFEVRTRD